MPTKPRRLHVLLLQTALLCSIPPDTDMPRGTLVEILRWSSDGLLKRLLVARALRGWCPRGLSARP